MASLSFAMLCVSDERAVVSLLLSEVWLVLAGDEGAHSGGRELLLCADEGEERAGEWRAGDLSLLA